MKPKIIIVWRKIGIAIGTAALLFLACSSSVQLSNVWQDPSYKQAPMKSVMVISINENQVKRRLWEDAFGYELSRHNVAATSSYQLFPSVSPDTNQIADAVRRNGYNGLIFITPLPTQTQATQVAPYVTSEPITRYNPWRETFSTRYVPVMHPGYVETSKIISHEIDVWSTNEQEHMVWSGTCTIADPFSGEQVRNETIGHIVRELGRASIISAK